MVARTVLDDQAPRRHLLEGAQGAKRVRRPPRSRIAGGDKMQGIPTRRQATVGVMARVRVSRESWRT